MFTWLQHIDRNISVHLCLSAFTEFTSQRFLVKSANKVPNMTPYRSGFPIDSIPPNWYHWSGSSSSTTSLSEHCWLHQFACNLQSSLNCNCSHIPCLVQQFYPPTTHYKATVYALTYLMSTNEYVILFHSESLSTIQEFNNSPHHHDIEAYTEVKSPSPS